MTGLVRFEAPDLAGWSATPLAESIDDAVVDGGPMYNGASHLVGTLRSPVLELDPFDEVVIAREIPRSGVDIETNLLVPQPVSCQVRCR